MMAMKNAANNRKLKAKAQRMGRLNFADRCSLKFVFFLPSMPHSVVFDGSQQAMDETEDHDQQQDKATVFPPALLMIVFLQDSELDGSAAVSDNRLRLAESMCAEHCRHHEGPCRCLVKQER
jgi:hypothetical protein